MTHSRALKDNTPQTSYSVLVLRVPADPLTQSVSRWMMFSLITCTPHNRLLHIHVGYLLLAYTSGFPHVKNKRRGVWHRDTGRWCQLRFVLKLLSLTTVLSVNGTDIATAEVHSIGIPSKLATHYLKNIYIWVSTTPIMYIMKFSYSPKSLSKASGVHSCLSRRWWIPLTSTG